MPCVPSRKAPVIHLFAQVLGGSRSQIPVLTFQFPTSSLSTFNLRETTQLFLTLEYRNQESIIGGVRLKYRRVNQRCVRLCLRHKDARNRKKKARIRPLKNPVSRLRSHGQDPAAGTFQLSPFGQKSVSQFLREPWRA